MNILATWLCSDGCIDNACEEGIGFCLYGCTEGGYGPFCCAHSLFGRLCIEICQPNCEFCISNSSCEKCNTGFYGSKCLNCPEHCLKCSSSSSCPVCYAGYFGTYCNKQCSNGCIVKVCEKVTGKCRFGCRLHYTGPHCSECKSGYHGENCTETCSTGCVEEDCLSNGTCTHGCKSDNFTGDNCYVKDGINDTTGVNTESEIGNVVYVHFFSINLSNLKYSCQDIVNSLSHLYDYTIAIHNLDEPPT